jgi:endonuclease YncB( thermonuclease family)
MPRRASDYGRVLPTHRWQGRSRGSRLWSAIKWWLAAAVLIALTWYLFGNQQIADQRMLQGPSEQVAGRFVRCGQRGSANCVPDGDTIKIGARTIRIIGIDAPELHPARCPREQQLGEAAARQLLALVNQGPFTLAGPSPVVRDEYGRELRHLLRARPDGSVQSLADDMVASGTTRAYLHGPREPWC